jgi:hypothetical protein
MSKPSLFGVFLAGALSMAAAAAAQTTGDPGAGRANNIEVGATDFSSGDNVAPGSGPAAVWGSDTLLNGPPYTPRPNAAEWRVNSLSGGRYVLWVKYAAAEPRPVRVLVNGRLVSASALETTTGCWTPDCRRWSKVAEVVLKSGENTVRFERDSYFPHLNRLLFVERFTDGSQYSASDLLTLCGQAVRQAEATSQKKACEGFIGATYAQFIIDAPAGQNCPGSPGRSLSISVLDWLTRHPELGSEGEVTGMRAAIKAMWCS